jgi:hypothetical protein
MNTGGNAPRDADRKTQERFEKFLEHLANADGNDPEIDALRESLRAAFALMTPSMRIAFFQEIG